MASQHKMESCAARSGLMEKQTSLYIDIFIRTNSNDNTTANL